MTQDTNFLPNVFIFTLGVVVYILEGTLDWKFVPGVNKTMAQNVLPIPLPLGLSFLI